MTQFTTDDIEKQIVALKEQSDHIGKVRAEYSIMQPLHTFWLTMWAEVNDTVPVDGFEELLDACHASNFMFQHLGPCVAHRKNMAAAQRSVERSTKQAMDTFLLSVSTKIHNLTRHKETLAKIEREREIIAKRYDQLVKEGAILSYEIETIEEGGSYTLFVKPQPVTRNVELKSALTSGTVDHEFLGVLSTPPETFVPAKPIGDPLLVSSATDFEPYLKGFVDERVGIKPENLKPKD